MNRARSPLLAAALALALGCVTPEPVPTEDHSAAGHPSATASKEPAPGKEAGTAPSKAPSKNPAQKGAAAAAPAKPGGGKTASPAKPEPGGPGEYFPLAVGNEWMYVDVSPALPENRRGVLRTVRILERTADGFFRDNERGNLRVDGSCVRDRDRRLLCQPFTVGATWTSVLSATTIERYEIASAAETVETPAGKFERCVRVRAHNRVKASIDQVLEITYAPKVGPVLIETYVVVDGRVTPQVKAMLRSYKVSGGT